MFQRADTVGRMVVTVETVMSLMGCQTSVRVVRVVRVVVVRGRIWQTSWHRWTKNWLALKLERALKR